MKNFIFQQAINLLFIYLVVRYINGNKFLLKTILANLKALINVFQLSTDYTPKQKKMKSFKVNNMLAMNTLK